VLLINEVLRNNSIVKVPMCVVFFWFYTRMAQTEIDALCACRSRRTHNDQNAKGNYATGIAKVDLYGFDGYPLGFDCRNPTVYVALLDFTFFLFILSNAFFFVVGKA